MLTRRAKNFQLIVMLGLFVAFILAGCSAFGGEKTWEEGHGELPDQIGNSESIDEQLFAPDYSDFVDFHNFIQHTEYNGATEEWFGGGKLGYGIAAGTMEAGEQFEIILFGHDPGGVEIERDIRIQLTTINEDYKQTELIMEEVIEIDSVMDREEIFSSFLPEENNVVYLLSVEIIGETKEIEDTLLGIIYVPAPELNAKLSMDKDVYLNDEEAIMTLANFGPTFLSLGKSYSIEKKVDDMWKVVPLQLEFAEIGIILKPDEVYDQTVDLSELQSGKYRIIKKFSGDGLGISGVVAAEFSIE